MEWETVTADNSGLGGGQYLMVTAKGLEFAEKWYRAEHIPPHISRLYQFILMLIWAKGIMAVGVARRMGYSDRIISQALSMGYAEFSERLGKLPEEVQRKIDEIVGRAPGEFYV